jgi:hypothetical protein
MKSAAPLKLSKEYPLPNEEALTIKLIALLKKLLEKDYLTGTTYRDTHAKGHVAVKGEFVIDPDLPQELRVGLFRQTGSYPCWIRFANLSPTPKPDIKPDIRSMSLKLMGVEGQMLSQDDENAKTMDLIMMGSQTFLAANLSQFYDMETAISHGGLSLVWFFLTHPRIAWTVLKASQKCANLLEVPYWSQTAYLFGDRAVQYHIKPHLPPTSRIPQQPANNYLRERLQQQLAREDVYFDFMVQFQTDAQKMPIENPMIAWDEKLSPYRKVATIKILSQSCDSPARMAFCENLAFDPWRALPEHRPLGGINRVRRAVYPAIAQFRHHKNNAPLREPLAGEDF